MEIKNINLVICPFECKLSNPHVYQSVCSDVVSFYVYCSVCGTCGPKRDTEAEAIAAWNKRAEPQLITHAHKIALDMIDRLQDERDKHFARERELEAKVKQLERDLEHIRGNAKTLLHDAGFEWVMEQGDGLTYPDYEELEGEK